MLEVGMRAPDFTLLNQDNSPITLSDYLGNKVVLYFYPKDNTPGCTDQACGFRDANDDLKDLGVIVLGVSKDSVASHKKFYSGKRLNFDILSDESMGVIKSYGAMRDVPLLKHTAVGVLRATFIINEEGIIEKVYPAASTSSHAQDVLNYLRGETHA